MRAASVLEKCTLAGVLALGSVASGCGGASYGGGGGGGNAPVAPTNLVATASNAQVNLSWSGSTGATSYNVKRSTAGGGPYTKIVNQAATNYTDSGLTNGTKYYYVLSALNAYGESEDSAEASATPALPPVDVTVTVDPTKTHAISPYIYGVNSYAGIPNSPPLLTLDRAGGNRWTAYNWINNGSNAGNDYFFQNDDYLCNGGCNASIPAEAVRMFIADDQANGMASLVTLQMQGYVSVDTTTVQVPMPFPDLNYFRPVVDKKSTASVAPFTVTPPPAATDNNVYMDEFAWSLDQKFSGMGIFGASPAHPVFIDLDNEPELWNTTHAEVQGSTMVTSTNYIDKTIALAKALKDQFPNAVVFGPSHYGFNGIYSWQGELSATPTGTNWFPDKYLPAIKGASTTYGKPLVDVYDFHWYPEDYDAGNTRITSLTATALSDAQVQLIVQSPRNLWDQTYSDNAAAGNSNPWVFNTLGAPIQMLPRLQAKITAENPGMKLSISEYEGGGWNHIAGTIAEADYLGIFGQEGLFAACLWPPSGTFSYAIGGFRAFRGFDGASATFGDTALQATSSNVQNVMVYASSDSAAPGRVVFVAINRSTANHVVAINGVALSGTAYIYQMTAATAQSQAGAAVAPVPAGTMPVSGSSLTVSLPALSVTTIDVH